ncbi:hypothetical protein MYX82_04250 [Acidobacteria bacterium AH-259-D05]|nr:hypothetical protein [Acidobacteria bacterium AH-259-D05]
MMDKQDVKIQMNIVVKFFSEGPFGEIIQVPKGTIVRYIIEGLIYRQEKALQILEEAGFSPSEACEYLVSLPIRQWPDRIFPLTEGQKHIADFVVEDFEKSFF